MTLIDLLIGMLIISTLAAVFLAFLFAGFRMGQNSSGKPPQATAPKKPMPRPRPASVELQEDPYIRATRAPVDPEKRIPTIEEE
jgi:hypothetical protein